MDTRPKRFIERSGDLYHEAGLIARPAAQWRRFDARYTPLVCEISPKGMRCIETRGALPDRAVTFTRKDRRGVTPQFDHAMMIVHALAIVELETLAKPGQRLVPVDEILARAPERARKAKQPLAIPVTIPPNRHLPELTSVVRTHVVPDALYGIEYLINGEKRYRFHALECENKSPKRRTTAKLSSLALKRAAYEAVMQSKGYWEVYGVPNFKIQIICGEPDPVHRRLGGEFASAANPE